MLEIGFRFLERGDGEVLGGGAVAEACELRKDEPHPVRFLSAVLELLTGLIEGFVLRIEEAAEVVGV